MTTTTANGLSGTTSIDQLLYGRKWAGASLTVAFPQNPSEVGYSVNAGYFHNLTSSDQSAVLAILQKWANVSGLTFTQVSDGASADISIYWYDSPDNTYARVAQALDDSREGGDIQLGGMLYGSAMDAGSREYFLVLQTIGLALGLKAPSTDVNGSPFSDSVYMSDSVMSQFSYSGQTDGPYRMDYGNYPGGPMRNDIAAIQYLYGPNNAASGDTTYMFDSSAPVVFQTVSDGGGNDTLFFGGYSTDLSIDLRAGHWSDLGGQYAQLDYGAPAVKPPGNIIIAGSDARYVIENVQGGLGNDTLIGNAADNQLRGNRGDDVLKPGAGADKLTGGEGNDTFDFSDGDGGRKEITDFSAGDTIKLRDVVAGGVIAQGDGAGLTAGQAAFGTDGTNAVLRVGLDATPGADLTIVFSSGLVGFDNLSLSGQTISYVADATAPKVASVAAPADGGYAAGQSLTFTVAFHEAVYVTGTPQLGLTIGSTGRQASYVSGSGTNSLVFSYAVQNGELDANGITIGGLGLNGGAIADGATNNATLTLNNVASTTGVLVDTVAPTVAMTGAPSAGTYIAGQNLDFTVNFSEAVVVTGAPHLALAIGTSVRYADYVSGSGTSSLLLRYTIQSGEQDANGITVGSLSSNGGAVKDLAGNDADLTLNNLASTAAVLVEAVRPFSLSVDAPAPGLYKAGDVLTVIASFNESVIVTGSPQLALMMGSATRLADYVIGSGSNALVFRYTVQSGDQDTMGVRINDLTLNGGTLKDAAGNDASLTVRGSSSARVDAVDPVVSSVSVPAAGVYKAGAALDFTVDFAEGVTVTGAPQLALTVGSTVRQAAYVSGSGGSALVFRYTVQNGETDLDGVAVGTLGLNGGTLKDAAGNSANLTLNAVGSTSNVLVNTASAAITSVTGPGAKTYKAGEALDFTVAFSEAVTLTGAPKLTVTLDSGGTAEASYFSGSGTNTLTFRYIVQAGDADADGVGLGNAINLNGGAIKDGAGGAAVVTGFTPPGLANVKVDAVAPLVQSIARVGAAVSNATTQAFTITFSEAVVGLSAADFVLTKTGSANGTVASVTGSGSTYTVNVDSVTGSGTLRLDLNAGAVMDAAGNANGAGFTGGQTITIDNTPPAAPTLAVVAGDDRISAGEVSGLVLSGTIEAGATVALTLGGVAKTASVSGTTWSYAVTQADIDALGAGSKAIAVTATDALGNVSAAGGRTVTIDAGALTPAPQPDPEPTRPPTLSDIATRPTAQLIELVLESLKITPSSTKTSNATITLPDGTLAPSTAAQVLADVNAAIAAYKAGLISQPLFEERLTQAVAPTTGVAHDAYTFFTGSAPTRAGMTWLIDSPDNPSDLTDGYYARFSVENRYINFAVNLGKFGEGRIAFESKYGGLIFADAVAKAYGEIIGVAEAQGAGVDVPAALRYIQSQEAYFRALGGDDLGAKAAMAGFILSVGESFHVGKYYEALEDYVVASIVGAASASPAWDLG
ncbi:M10 family metallopeptidase C-terminal domain-containing protein [Caulobacter sp.]|uniref:M10 family metallopeptidase C-terminal domain-containing protein n=1 Tax=Caulobacter sp. TaxID=78 RepID=UPI002B46E3A3|nr:M10 family metallopeptidase C-terminal domain-containing protein [Caulobacter sp.]HJV43018.1 M10 family metallopeptidase C-terminal domain-containing protein [Caulobacter sp.]